MDTDSINNLGTQSGTATGGEREPNLQTSTFWISRGGANSESNKITFRKKRIIYSYGFAFRRVDVQSTDVKYPSSGIATPLASLWVDFLPSYLTSAEFNSLPHGSYATQARCNVLGSRTSFETGSSLSGFANSEHVPIGIIATDINNITYGKNVEYSTAVDKPMIPTIWADLKVANIVNKYYNEEPCMAMGVPRSAYGYWWYRQNKNIPIVDNGNQNPFDYGQINLSEYTDRFLVNSALRWTIDISQTSHYE